MRGETVAVDLRASTPDAAEPTSAADATPALDPTGETMIDLTARRCDVVRRLLDRGVPPLALRALLPGWDPVIAEAVSGR
jgi:hypothetical protein